MAISLPAVVTSFLTKVKTDLSVGQSIGTNLTMAPMNFVRAQDIANVLRLLQSAMADTGTMTATGTGTVYTVVDGASSFVAGSQVGNVVTFTGNTTAALAGAQGVVTSNTTTTLTFSVALPGIPVATDTYTIRGAFVDAAIVQLMDGRNPAVSAPLSSTFAHGGITQDALGRIILTAGGSLAGSVHFTTTALAGTSTTIIAIDTRGTKLIVDEFRGLTASVNGVVTRCIGNTETAIYLDRAVTAPAGGEAVILRKDTLDNTPNRVKPFAGGQPGDNYRLAGLIDAAQTAVLAYTLPT